MRKTKNFNISVPELGDRPDITQVSNAIQSLEDALAGTVEMFDGNVQGNILTLTSPSRTTKRTKYYNGFTCQWVANNPYNANTITNVNVDGLGNQAVTIGFDIRQGDAIQLKHNGTRFEVVTLNIPRSNLTDSSSDFTIATSLAVKKVNDNANNKANKNGDTFTGDIKLDISAAQKRIFSSGNLGILFQENNLMWYDWNTGYQLINYDRLLDRLILRNIYTQSINATGKFNIGTYTEKKGEIGYSTSGIYLKETKSDKSLKLNDDGSLTYGGFNVYREDFKPTPADIGALNVDGKSKDSALLNGLSNSVAQTPNTIMQRDVNGDTDVNYIRTHAPDESYISGGIAFRTNADDDSGIKICSSKSAIRDFIRAFNKDGDTIAGWVGFDTSLAVQRLYSTQANSGIAFSPTGFQLHDWKNSVSIASYSGNMLDFNQSKFTIGGIQPVQDIRMSNNIQVITWQTAIDTYSSGRVITGVQKDNVDKQLDSVYYANLQKKVNGTWITVTTTA